VAFSMEIRLLEELEPSSPMNGRTQTRSCTQRFQVEARTCLSNRAAVRKVSRLSRLMQRHSAATAHPPRYCVASMSGRAAALGRRPAWTGMDRHELGVCVGDVSIGAGRMFLCGPPPSQGTKDSHSTPPAHHCDPLPHLKNTHSTRKNYTPALWKRPAPPPIDNDFFKNRNLMFAFLHSFLR
jgi:hypothetical protein